MQQIKTSMWPLLWVGKLTYCEISRQSRSEVKSFAKTLEGSSMWMLKSSSMITLGDMAHTDVNSDENSVRKTAVLVVCRWLQ